jgi:hypothetical protein
VLQGAGGDANGLECYYSLFGGAFPVLGLLVGKDISNAAPAFGRASDGIAASALAIHPGVTVGPSNDAWLARVAARDKVSG